MEHKNISLGKNQKFPFMIIAGPCAIESLEQIKQVAEALKKENVLYLRGGLYKMRTQAKSFQGLQKEGIEIILSIKKDYGLNFVSEITDPRQVDSLMEVVDIFQVGTRNMFNYELLKELGQLSKPVLLKRSFSALVKEWLLATEYITRGGNEKIILCERGIRTFETSTRNTMDLSGALLAKKESPFPVIADPSHGTGRAELVTPMALATVASGLDGLLIEIHPNPEKALSDGYQSLNLNQFQEMMKQVKKLLHALKRPFMDSKDYEKRDFELSSRENKKNIRLHSQ